MRAVPFLAAPFFLLSVGTVTDAHDNGSNRGFDVDDGVAGIYVGSAGSYTNVDGFETYSGTMTCDLEVGGDGSQPVPQDEFRVDGYLAGGDPSFPSALHNKVPDTWNDGGRGGACHTDSYGYNDYNTPGCFDDGAMASQVESAAVWIAAGCDWVASGIVCPSSGLPGGTTVCTIGGTHGDPPCASPPPCTTTCGSDGVVDALNFGRGDTFGGVRYPTAGLSEIGCPFENAIMVVFVFDAVVVEGTTAMEYKATSGEIWQVP